VRVILASQPSSSGRNGTPSPTIVALANTLSMGACTNRICPGSASISSATSIGSVVVIPCPIS